MSAELHIPAAVADKYFVCGCSESGIRAGYRPDAIPLIVAAELRRLRDQIEPHLAIVKTEVDCAPHPAEFGEGAARALDAVVAELTSRADELDPSGAR